MVKRLLTLVIVGAFSVSYAVQAQSSRTGNTTTEKTKSSVIQASKKKHPAAQQKNTDQSKKKVTNDVNNQKKATNAIKPQKESLGSNSSLAKGSSDTGNNSEFGIPIETASAFFLNNSRLSQLLGSKETFGTIRITEDEDFEDSSDGSLNFSEEIFVSSGSPFNNSLSYSLSDDVNSAGLYNKNAVGATNSPKKEKNQSSFGIRSSFKGTSLAESTLPTKGNQKSPTISSDNLSGKFKAFAINSPKPFTTVSLNTGYELGAPQSQFDYEIEDVSSPSLQASKGVAADIPLGGGSFNIGVSYVVGRLNSIYQNETDFSKKYADWVDDKNGLITLNLQYSHPIGKQTTWYGYAGYTAGNKLYHNTEGFSNLFGGSDVSTSGYAVKFGLKHSF